MRVGPFLWLLLCVVGCSLERTPLLPDQAQQPTGGTNDVRPLAGAAQSGGNGPPVAGDPSTGGAEPVAPMPDAGGEPPPTPPPEIDAGVDAAIEPPAPPDASTPAVTGPDFPQGSCPPEYMCQPFLILGFMCQKGGMLLPCGPNLECPYDAVCGSQGQDAACFLNCTL